MTAAMAVANMQPIKSFVMRPDLLSTCAGATGTSCPAKRSAGADELVNSLELPPASLASSPSPALDTCASQAACRRESGPSGSVRALMLWRPSAGVGPFVLTGVSFSALLALALRKGGVTLISAICRESLNPTSAQCVSQAMCHNARKNAKLQPSQ
jgi:hypothetical protein